MQQIRRADRARHFITVSLMVIGLLLFVFGGQKAINQRADKNYVEGKQRHQQRDPSLLVVDQSGITAEPEGILNITKNLSTALKIAGENTETVLESEVPAEDNYSTQVPKKETKKLDKPTKTDVITKRFTSDPKNQKQLP